MCAATFNTRQITDTGLMYQRRGPLIKCDVEFNGLRNGGVLCFGWALSEVRGSFFFNYYIFFLHCQDINHYMNETFIFFLIAAVNQLSMRQM